MSDPSSDPAIRPGTTLADQALERLMLRMQESGDFPAMAHAVSNVLTMTGSDSESVGAVANEILKDVGLSNKLLRVVSSAYYARGGPIATVSRAVSLVGFNTIRNMALGLVLLERMKDKAHADMLTQEFLRALLAATIARELCPDSGDAEEVFIGAMFQDLGRLLVMFYFPQEAQQIAAMLVADPERITPDVAAVRVLGLGFDTLALAVARTWELPQDICRYMRKPGGEPPRRVPGDPCERLRWISVAANAIADTMLLWELDRHAERLEPVCLRYTRAIGIAPADMQQALVAARTRLNELVVAMEIRLDPGSDAQRLLQGASTAAGSGEGAAPVPAPVPAQSAAEVLTAGIEAVTQLLAQDFKLSTVIRKVIETIHRSKGFDHIVFCMLDPRPNTLTGRYGLGEGVDDLVRAFRIPLLPDTPDLFQMVCAKGADTLVADLTVPRVADRLPAWYQNISSAQAILLLPMMLRDKPLGLIYADCSQRDVLILNERELALLKTLRNLLVTAFSRLQGGASHA